MTQKHLTGLALMTALSACGEGSSLKASNTSEAAAALPVPARTCENIRSDVIRIADSNGVKIVKIYDPKVVKNETKKISCSGRALVSSGQEVVIYYRDSQDADGDWLVQYAEERLD